MKKGIESVSEVKKDLTKKDRVKVIDNNLRRNFQQRNENLTWCYKTKRIKTGF